MSFLNSLFVSIYFWILSIWVLEISNVDVLFRSKILISIVFFFYFLFLSSCIKLISLLRCLRCIFSIRVILWKLIGISWFTYFEITRILMISLTFFTCFSKQLAWYNCLTKLVICKIILFSSLSFSLTFSSLRNLCFFDIW